MSELKDPELPVYFDLYNESLIIGEPAYEAAIEAMERSGFPADIHSLHELVNSDVELPSFVEPGKKDKYSDKTREDFINDGRWLLGVVGNLTYRRIGRLCQLGLMPYPSTLANQKYFGNLPAFQELIGQEDVSWYGAFNDWDAIDVLLHLRNIGRQEKKRPTHKVITRRVASGKKEPGLERINKILPFMEAVELAGYVVPTGWGPRQYEEWGYLFYLANNRVPVGSDLYSLSPRYLSPSDSGVKLAYARGISEFKQALARYIIDRKQIQLEELETSASDEEIEMLAADVADEDELIRRFGRYRVTELLFPSANNNTYKRLCRNDVIDAQFVTLLHSYDNRVRGWMVEAAARRAMVYPELFPEGEFIKQLKVANRGASFFSDISKINEEELALLIDEEFEGVEKTNEIQQQALSLIMQGCDLDTIAQQVLGVKNDKRLRKDYLGPLKSSLHARNYAHLVRRAVHAQIITIEKSGKPVLSLKQREILELISYGASQKTIASILNIVIHSVSLHVGAIKKRLGAKNEAEAVAVGYSTGDLYLPFEGSLWGNVKVSEDDILEAELGFPKGFLKSIRALEIKLSNPPPIEVIIRELKESNGITFNGE